MRPPVPRSLVAAIAAAVVAGAAVAGGALGVGASDAGHGRAAEAAAAHAKTVRIKDARLKFEINATDRDGGVQVFIDAESWKEMTILDPAGTPIFRTATSGRMGKLGGTELFLESSEPMFQRLPLPKLLKRFPAGTYAFRGVGLRGERYVGSARLTHRIPDGPVLVSPLAGGRPQDPAATTVAWKTVAPPKGSRIIAYQVLVVQAKRGPRALPELALDVMMPPTATSLRVPPGFLAPGSEYDWEVLAIEAGGNQTISSDSFTTAP
ncbi:MAG TPA: hypothetical protein VHK00_05240 [Miltoncostaeaceae bacterium]|nr:hypothetical protein [Miltoncostaeaceae bacterium]